jgi:hypothetical protein
MVHKRRFKFFVMHSKSLGDRYSIIDTKKKGEEAHFATLTSKEFARKLVNELNKTVK